jgi:glutaredoxin 3
MAEVIVYTTKVCPYCVRAKDLLKRKGQAYTEIDASDDDAREAMIAKAGGRRTVPQIFINGEHIGGSDDLYALEKAGTLDALLQKSN